ncbi:MAG TPA: hypothetical protein VLT89_03530 [Usitatibacter sp.]|nr:hypothetical protein [Usitatibacter sp.]
MIVLLATVVAFGFSIHMMAQLIGYTSPWMVLMLFMCFLGLAKMAEPVYMLKLPAWYRALRTWERAGEVYRKLGVRQFGTLLKDTPLRFMNLTVYVSGDRRDLRRICRQVESAEAIHFWSAILLLPYLVLCIWTRTWAPLGWFSVLL